MEALLEQLNSDHGSQGIYLFEEATDPEIPVTK